MYSPVWNALAIFLGFLSEFGLLDHATMDFADEYLQVSLQMSFDATLPSLTPFYHVFSSRGSDGTTKDTWTSQCVT